MRKRSIFLGVLMFLILIQCSNVQAGITYRYGFECVTILNTRTFDQQVGEEQLYVDVSDAGTDADGYNQVLFTIGNEGSNLASICAIYFDDGTLLAMSNIYESTGVVNFKFDSVSPPDLIDPDKILVPEFVVTEGFLCDSDNPTIGGSGVDPDDDCGVDPGESISILFTLKQGKSFAHTIAALEGGADDVDDDLRIGLFVLGIGLPDSPPNAWGQECYVNSTTRTHLPAPGAIVLGGIGVFFVGWLRRSRTL